jgi:serine phosphatase RsbU (regulator of sigma subunit)
MISYSDPDGQHIVALDRASISIGRSPGQDIVLRDPAVSRQHAVIVRDGEIYTLVDQESSRGTFLNGVRVHRGVLQPDDVVQLGSLKGSRLRVHLRPAEQAPGVDSLPLGDLLPSFGDLQLPGSEPRTAAREMEQLNWLLRAARQLNEGGAIKDILGVLLRLTLQLTGVERGFVFLCKEGNMRFAQGLGALGQIADDDLTISRQAMQKAIDSGLKFSVSDTLADDRASEWSSVLANNIRTIYCIPLRRRIAESEPAQLLGLLYLDSQIRPGMMTEIDHQLLDTIASEAAALVQTLLLAEADRKARAAREELAIAARIHKGLMANTLPAVPYAAIEARSIPCLAIGGDFYDVLELEDCMCATIVDVSGKGVPAAIVAATLQGIIHAQLLAGQSLAQVAAMANHFLCTRNVGKYATMVMLRLFPDGRIEYMNCGHIKPISIFAGEVRRLEESHLIVGLVPGATYASTYDRLRPSERLLLVTDGLTEAENSAGDLFGDAGLSEAALGADLDAILARVMAFQAPAPAQDDMTLIEIRYAGSK